jgi:hypothetical protein
MTTAGWLQFGFVILLLAVSTPLLGLYMAKVYGDEKKAPTLSWRAAPMAARSPDFEPERDGTRSAVEAARAEPGPQRMAAR